MFCSRLHRVRQVVVGHRQGALAQPAQRVVERAGQHHGERHRDDQGEQHQRRLDDRLPDDVRTRPRRRRRAAGPASWISAHRIRSLTAPMAAVASSAVTSGRCPTDRVMSAGDPVGEAAPRHRRPCCRPALRCAGSAAQGEGEQRLLLAGQGGHEGGELLLVEPAGGQRGEGDRLLLGDGRLGAGERGHRPPGVGQALLAGQLGQRVAVRDQVGEDDAVAQASPRRPASAGGPAPPAGCRSSVARWSSMTLEPVPHRGRHVAELAPLARGTPRSARRCGGPAGCSRPACWSGAAR